jgi:cbb3-type cytochrome oxidase subunit 3
MACFLDYLVFMAICFLGLIVFLMLSQDTEREDF